MAQIPVRWVHVGLGAFHRAHQAYYAQQVNEQVNEQEKETWGIAAFSGRRPQLADALTDQGCNYTLVTRAAEGDKREGIRSIVAAHHADDRDAWLGYFADPDVTMVTLTVTEAGYSAGPGGLLHDDEAVRADVEALRSGAAASATVIGRLVDGLRSRRGAGAGAINLLSCDNLSGNGDILRSVVGQLAEQVDSSLAEWIHTHVGFPNAMVDRITPATTQDDVAGLAAIGIVDRVPVVTEPFSEWVIEDAFLARRPPLERVGVAIVDAVESAEDRKLLLLNGGHSLLAYVGLLVGHAYTYEAVGDARIRGLLETYWDEAARVLEAPVDEIASYRSALLNRFANSRIRHGLEQIATDGSQKNRLRSVAVAERWRDQGLGVPEASSTVLAAWVLCLRSSGVRLADVERDRFVSLASGPVEEAVRRVLDALVVGGRADDALVAEVGAQVVALTQQE